MNTKFSVTLLAVLIVLLVSLAVTSSFSNASKSAGAGRQPEPVMIPATGGNDLSDFYQRRSELSPANDLSDYYQRHSELSSAVEMAREVQAPRLWSGEVFLSDNDAPDITPGAKQDRQRACMSEDDLPRRYSGCVE